MMSQTWKSEIVKEILIKWNIIALVPIEEEEEEENSSIAGAGAGKTPPVSFEDFAPLLNYSL